MERIEYLLLFILCSFGMSWIIMFGSIFDRLRPDWKIFKCGGCTGFWTGLLTYILFWLSNIHLFNNLYIGLFLFGCLSSGTTYILSTLFNDNGIQVRHN